jgi:high-affinity nickel-transport protein
VWQQVGVVGDHFELKGCFWSAIGVLTDDYHFGLVGAVIVGIFIVSWLASIIVYRCLGYHKSEVAVARSRRV